MDQLKNTIAELANSDGRITKFEVEKLDDLHLIVHITFADGVSRSVGAQLEEPGVVSAPLREQIIGSIMKTLETL